MLNKDEELEKLCKAVSDHLFNSNNLYDPYTTVVITGTNVKVTQDTLSIPIDRYKES